MGCSSCHDTGMPMGCPMCGRIGKIRKKPNSSKRRLQILNETPEQRQIRQKEELAERKRQRELKRIAKMEEIKALWNHANPETWKRNKRDYTQTVKRAKMKEQNFIMGDDE